MGVPKTLPADFFDKQRPAASEKPPTSLPPDFFDKQEEQARAKKEPETFLQKSWPQGATISARNRPSGLAGIEQDLADLRQRLSTHLAKGQGQGVGDFMGSLPLGLLRLLKGGAEVPQGKVWEGTKDVVGGGFEAGTIPLSFVAPESAGKKISTVAAEDAAKLLTDAINPLPKQMASFQKGIAEHLDKIVTFAAQKGIKLDSIEGVATAMKEASSSIRSHYYQEILAPFKDLPVDLSRIKGYSGQTASPSTATLEQLDARLSQINAELHPKFQKAGEAAVRAAVKSESELNAEAAGIRTELYGRLGKVSGLGEQVVAKTRQAFGALEELYQKTADAGMKTRFAANKAAHEPLTINPFSNTKTFVADKAISKIQGNPVQNAIRKAMSSAEVQRYQLPKPNPAAAATVSRSAPVRGVSKVIGEVAEPSASERGAVPQKLAARRLANELAKQKADLDSLVKSSRHPFWKGAGE